MSLAAVRITTLDFLHDLIDRRLLALQQTGPDALVFGAGWRRWVGACVGIDAEQAGHHLLRRSNPGVSGEYRRHGRHLFSIGFWTLRQTSGELGVMRLDDVNDRTINC